MIAPVSVSARPDPKSNRLLARLQPEEYLAVIRAGKIVSLKYGKRLYRHYGLVDAVYFPIDCMISLFVTRNGRPQLELATIGNEGVIGAAELHRQQAALGLSLILIPGAAVRIDAPAFARLLHGVPAVRTLDEEHTYALMRQIMYKAACNRLHSMEERCSRGLLLTHDGATGDTFPLTQESLSHMLGVRRATVNVATATLRKAGLIHYVRGKLTVVDRSGLESASCRCYLDIIRAYESLFPSPAKRPSKPD